MYLREVFTIKLKQRHASCWVLLVQVSVVGRASVKFPQREPAVATIHIFQGSPFASPLELALGSDPVQACLGLRRFH